MWIIAVSDPADDVLLVVKIPRDPRNIVLDGDWGFPTATVRARGSVHPLSNYFGLLLFFGFYIPGIIDPGG